ncbi:50S ribosomal protein L34 [Metallosphaera cuprina]|uniref:50S ribosomal protein L34 n=1 Tax=Metallosphaera cuprina TaxID=1006005 RepID=UPI00064EC2E9
MKPFQRTGSIRKIYRRVPSGKSKILVKRERRNKSNCALCKRPLRGDLRSVQRIYGGYLCHICLKNLIKMSMRGNS